jgi:hypothetical protein
MPDQRKKFKKRLHTILKPRGRQAIAVTVSVATIFVIMINTLAYLYIQAYPPYTSIFRVWDCFKGIQIQNKGVDTV